MKWDQGGAASSFFRKRNLKSEIKTAMLQRHQPKDPKSKSADEINLVQMDEFTKNLVY
ncbi:hypothetical protein J7E71_17140 [Mesobacillus foraminis]|uniref:hypothetical protein n=1 Tax=Mesobacillus foraminis TaxID=279826 RepID=UPI001BE6B911|nr:hypothetical protein [Mesobacillus foraminis]MBT2757617.1 hypothetical protein [Mesobacillus foraminis]